MPKVGLLDDQSRTQSNGFLSCYPEDYTSQENSIYYDVIASPKNHFKVFGDWSASNVKYQEPTRSKGLIRMLKKNYFVVYLINEYKTSSHCPTCENELEKFKTVPNPRPYQRKKKPDVLCNGLLR
jgi:hypothetical protein